MGRFLFVSLSLLPLAFSASLTNCPLLGPAFPAPRSLNAKVLGDAFQNLTRTLNHDVAVGNSTHGVVNKDTSYAVQFFSLYEDKPAFEWYHTPQSIRNGSFGTKQIDGDSIFRIGSITKLLTAYALLTELGDTYWDQPVTKFLPELQGQSQRSRSDPINFLDWEDVTLGALASHLAGVTRDLESNGGLSADAPESLLANYGIPPLPRSDLPPCLENTTTPCDRSEFLAALATRQPVYAPNTTPIYSNTGFQILAYVLESIKGRSFPDILQERIFSPLSLLSTSTIAPSNDSQGVIPGDPGSSGWNYNLGKASGFGGIYSTASDLTKVGKSILNSTLLDPNITRSWLKPVTHTSSLTFSVGRPWEIGRQALSQTYEHVTDFYTKTGSENSYSSLIALMPDYNVGFITLASGGSDEVIGEILIDAVVPHLETAARQQAETVFAGTYTGPEGNSSITLGTNASVPGLQITEWISNGKNMFEALSIIYGFSLDSVQVVLQPTNLESSVAAAGNGTSSRGQVRNAREIAFRAIYEQSTPSTDFGVIGEACTSWLGVDGLNYGDFALDQFLITIVTDEDGQDKAMSITPRFLHVTLDREH